jgi:hypothetical protein
MDDLHRQHRCATLHLIFPLLGRGKLDFYSIVFALFLTFQRLCPFRFKKPADSNWKKIPLNRCIQIFPKYQLFVFLIIFSIYMASIRNIGWGGWIEGGDPSCSSLCEGRFICSNNFLWKLYQGYSKRTPYPMFLEMENTVYVFNAQFIGLACDSKNETTFYLRSHNSCQIIIHNIHKP